MNWEITFKDEKHQNRFADSINLVSGDGQKLDREYGSALFLLTSTAEIWNRSKKHVSREGIDFQTMLEKGTFSSGEQVVANLAWELFGAYGSSRFIISDLTTSIDSDYFKVCIQAIILRQGGNFT